MWITTPKTEKVLHLLYDMMVEQQDRDKEQALWYAYLILKRHRKETEDCIKNGIEAIKQLNRFGRFLTRFCKIQERVK